MRGLRALLRFAWLAIWLPLHGGRGASLAHASFAESDGDNSGQDGVAVSEGEDEKQQENGGFTPAPFPFTTLPPRSEDALVVGAVLVTEEDKKPTSGSPAKKTPYKTPFLAVIFGLAILAGALALDRIIRPRGVPPALSLELENALALLPDVEGLAKAVGTDQAKEARRRAESFILEAQKVCKEAAVKVGAPREKAIVEAKSNLADAVSAVKELLEETKRTAIKDVKQLPHFGPVAPWYEAMKSMAGENEYLKAVNVVMMSFESAARLASQRSTLACEKLESAAFTSMADGPILRQSLKDFLALQLAGEEVLRLLGWAEKTQHITLKTLSDDQEIRRSATRTFLKEKIGAGFQACQKMLETMKANPPQGVDIAKLEEIENKNDKLKRGAEKLLAAHGEVVASMIRAETPEDHSRFITQAKAIENRLNEAGNRLWTQAGNYGNVLQDAEIIVGIEVQKLLLECSFIEMKADTYRKHAARTTLTMFETLKKRFSADAGEPSSRFLPAKLVSKLQEEAQATSNLVDTQLQNLKGLLTSTRQWADIRDPGADVRVILEELERGVGSADRELFELVKSCQGILQMHMDACFMVTLEDYMDASTQTVERFSGAIEEKPAAVAQLMQRVVEKYEKAKSTAKTGASLLIVSHAAAHMGKAGSRLETIAFKSDRGIL